MKFILRVANKNCRKWREEDGSNLGVLRLGGVLINTDPHVSGVGDAGHEISDEDVLLVYEVHVKEVRKGPAVEQSNDVWVHVQEEREGRRNIGTEHGALVLLDPLPEEHIWLLEPEVV